MRQRYITIFKKTSFYKKKLCPSLTETKSFLKIFLQKAQRQIKCFLLLDGAAERR